jgi:hypothetical protein
LGFNYFYAFFTQIPNIILKTLILYSAKVLIEEDSKFTDLILEGAKKDFFLHFKCYNLEIYVANFFEKGSTHYLNSLKQSYSWIPYIYIYIFIWVHPSNEHITNKIKISGNRSTRQNL